MLRGFRIDSPEGFHAEQKKSSALRLLRTTNRKFSRISTMIAIDPEAPDRFGLRPLAPKKGSRQRLLIAVAGDSSARSQWRGPHSWTGLPRSFEPLCSKSVQGDTPPRSIRPIGSLNFQGPGKADQASRIRSRRIDAYDVVAVLSVESSKCFDQQGGMMRVVGIIGESHKNPGTIPRAAPSAASRQLGMVTEYGVASLDGGEQFDVGAANIGWSNRIDV